MHLVVGATGTVGFEIVRLLRERGAQVRALVRTSSAPDRVAQLRELGATTVVGDLKSRASLDEACRGVECVLSTASALLSQQPDDSFDRVDSGGQQALIDAAAGARVSRFVFVSVLGLTPLFAFAAAKLDVEHHLQESGLDYTILQPTCFMDTWLTPHVGFDFASGAVNVYGDGRQPLSYVLSADVARFAVDAAMSPEARNATLPVLGPQRLTQLDAVRIFEEVSGRAFTVQMVPTDALEGQLAGAAHAVEQAFAGLTLRYAGGDPPGTAQMPGPIPQPTTTVRDFATRVLAS